MNKGYRWYKCDLHLHTTTSKCFQDKSITPEQWVQECIDKGLHCVAVTDHNTSKGIAGIQEVAKEKGLFVFPGVEITCDSSGIHLLVLFDIDTPDDYISSFLSKCDILPHMFGEEEAHTKSTIFKIVKYAKDFNALVIPAHIDEFNGLGKLKHKILIDFLENENINAVQVVHHQFLNKKLDESISSDLNNYYGKPISNETIKNWHKPVQKAQEKNLAILTFSDNPHAPQNPRHGLDGIGKRFTWIQMDQTPNIEGLRQAFLAPSNRIQNDFQGKSSPKHLPRFTLKHLEIENSLRNKLGEPFRIDFHHQLNSIIGGPGSGKSSILKSIRGILNNMDDILPSFLSDIKQEQLDFYKQPTRKNKKGVFKNDSIVSLAVQLDGIDYKIVASNIKDQNNQDFEVYKIQDGAELLQKNPKEFIKSFEVDHYSQKQIFLISQDPSALRNRINKAMPSFEENRDNLKKIEAKFLAQSAKIRELYSEVHKKKEIEVEIQKIENQIETVNKSRVSEEFEKKAQFEKQKSFFKETKSVYSNKLQAIDSLIMDLEKKEASNSVKDYFNEENLDEVTKILFPLQETVSSTLSVLQTAREKFQNEIQKLDKTISSSDWQKQYESNTKRLNELVTQLEKEGIKGITKIDSLLEKKRSLNETLKKIAKHEIQRDELIQEKEETQKEYFKLKEELSLARQNFIRDNFNDKSIEIKIFSFQDKLSFEQTLEQLLNLNSRFDGDLKKLINLCFRGKPKDKINQFRKEVTNLRYKEDDVKSDFGKKFRSFFKKIDDATVDKLLILVPEDKVELRYKPKGEKKFKQLGTASAGQKASAVLTFILSFGENPLILDQPEDDLNSKLVYELIVEKIKSAKKDRQIVIVTHNANIPVNADADLITCMNSSTRHMEIYVEGTLENEKIKAEICDTMEGSAEAFNMRAKRYTL